MQHYSHLATATNILWKLIEANDHDPEALYRNVGIDPDLLNKPGARVIYTSVNRLWTKATEIIDDPCFGLKASKYWHPSYFHALGYAWLASHFCAISETQQKGTKCGEKIPGDNEMGISITNKKKFFAAIILFSIIVIVLSGCAMSDYGKLTSKPEVKQSFETYQILPNHKYYFRGVKSKPTVIVGINEDYELNLKLWVQIDPGSEDFRILIDRVSLQGMGTTIEPWGFNIIDEAGNYVGVWYSAIRAAAVKVNENRQIVNLQPSTTVTVGDQLQ